MKLPIYAKDKGNKGTMELPQQFHEPIRHDLIKKAVLALQNAKRQPYGSKIGAGMRHSVEISKRRRDYRGSYGHGISRVPRKILSRRGTRMNWVGAEAPGMRGGRKAHPPKADKIWDQKLNEKEKRKAIRSALSATLIPFHITARGHIPPQGFPFLMHEDIESMTKTKDVKNMLLAIGCKEELARSSVTTNRAGVGKRRGRRIVRRIGPLIVVSKDCELLRAAKNIPGIDVVRVDALNAELLAPGTHPGRFTLYTTAAIERLATEHLFLKETFRGANAVAPLPPRTSAGLKKEKAQSTPAPAEQAAGKQAANKTAPKPAPQKPQQKAAQPEKKTAAAKAPTAKPKKGEQ
jgi:large subunit ribosomal protein L4e